MGLYLRPQALDEAVAALGRQTLSILAGGTDWYPARVDRPLTDDILDITGIAGLRRIEIAGDEVVFGALATWSDVLAAPLPPLFDGLKLAAREVGGAQIQNAGTLAGNLCNASPAADGAPALLALDAVVELVSIGGRRSLALADFLVAPRRTALRPDELVVAIRVPLRPAAARSTFLKLGARAYLVISVVMVSAVVATDATGRIAACRVAVGACSPVAQRLPGLEAALEGVPLAPGIGQRVETGHIASLSPIDDVRGTGVYRREAARTLVARALERLA